MTFDDAFRNSPNIARFWPVAEHLSNMRKALPTSETQFYGVSAAPKRLSPLCKGSRFPVQLVSVGSASVVGLLDRRRPANVSRFVSLVVVNAIYRRTLRWFSHVCVEGGKIIPPLVADSDATASPKVVPSAVWVVAAILHVGPSVVRTAISQPVFCRRFGGSLSL
jgi:hypothetical protein